MDNYVFNRYSYKQSQIESSIKVSDSFADSVAQTNELNDCGRKVVNVTENDTEDFTCDTADLIPTAEFSGGWETPAEWKEEVVAVVLHLDMNYKDIAADEQNFGEEVREDVLRAAGAGVKPDQIKIKGVRSGSVLVDLEVTGGVVSAEEIAKSLKDQVGCPNSVLLKGRHTCNTKRLEPREDASVGIGESAMKAVGAGKGLVRTEWAGDGEEQEIEGKRTPREKFAAAPPNKDSLHDGVQGMDPQSKKSAHAQAKDNDESASTSVGLKGNSNGSDGKVREEDSGSRNVMIGATDFLPTPSPAPAPVSKGGNAFLSSLPTALDELPGMDEVLSKPSPFITSSKQPVEMREVGSKAGSDGEGGQAMHPASEVKMAKDGQKLLPKSDAASLELPNAASPESVGEGKRSFGVQKPQVQVLWHLEGAAGAPSLSPVGGGDGAGGGRGSGILGIFGRRPEGLRPRSVPSPLSSLIQSYHRHSMISLPHVRKNKFLQTGGVMTKKLYRGRSQHYPERKPCTCRRVRCVPMLSLGCTTSPCDLPCTLYRSSCATMHTL